MSTQLSFTLSTSDKVKSVHLLGSWDNYKQQVPLSESRAGKWKGTFKFPSTMVKGGSRYWYYFHIDGFKPVHDPNEKSTTEPTTGRKLNILDVPKGSSNPAAHSSRSSGKTARSNRESMEIPKGRAISPSKIIHPKPSKPYESRHVREADYSASPVDELCDKLEKASMYKMGTVSPPSSVGSSLSSRSSGGSSPDSLSSLSDPSSSSSSCRCNKYGVTRKGDRVKLDCGGRLCGYSDDSSSCSSIESESESEEERSRPTKTKPRYVELQPKRASQATASSGRRARR
jgi:hypothetical protein